MISGQRGVNAYETGDHSEANITVGQSVGLMDSVQDTRTVVREFMEDYLTAVERMNATLEE